MLEATIETGSQMIFFFSPIHSDLFAGILIGLFLYLSSPLTFSGYVFNLVVLYQFYLVRFCSSS